MPRKIVQFQWLLFAALALDLANNLVGWPEKAAVLSARGVYASPAVMVVSAIASPVVGLIFWYFIARRRSVVAKWIMTVLVVLGVVGFIVATMRAGAAPLPLPLPLLLVLGIAAEMLKVAAVQRLFTPEAKAWLGG